MKHPKRLIVTPDILTRLSMRQGTCHMPKVGQILFLIPTQNFTIYSDGLSSSNMHYWQNLHCKPDYKPYFNEESYDFSILPDTGNSLFPYGNCNQYYLD